MFTATSKTIRIDTGEAVLKGDLSIPEDAERLVIFAHGSGSSRLSSRNRLVAEKLNGKNIATLLFDLLTAGEDLSYSNRFDISLLTRRLISTTEWIWKVPEFNDMPTAYFGASTGAASALNAAAHYGNKIKAVVSRGGRPDLAMENLGKVTAPALLIIGSKDQEVIRLNQSAFDKLQGNEHQMEIVEGATHLFQEPGKLEEVARLAGEWFEQHVK